MHPSCDSRRSTGSGVRAEIPRRWWPRRAGIVLVAAVLVMASCGGAVVRRVTEGTYGSIVPTSEQLGADVDGALPGGVARLRDQGVERIEVAITAEGVIVRLDGVDTAALDVTERVAVTDREGSGPIKAQQEILVLSGSLDLGGLVIDEPVIWPGTFEGSPVITITSRSSGEQGPDVSCTSDESCLLLSAGVEPAGRYADANDPELGQNPIESIEIDAGSVDITLDNGEHVSIAAGSSSSTRACGLSENRTWDVPVEVGLPIDEPVLIHTLCPSTPGAAVQLVIMDRAAIPTLAPLTEEREGDWCAIGPGCLLFVPE